MIFLLLFFLTVPSVVLAGDIKQCYQGGTVGGQAGYEIPCNKDYVPRPLVSLDELEHPRPPTCLAKLEAAMRKAEMYTTWNSGKSLARAQADDKQHEWVNGEERARKQWEQVKRDCFTKP